MSRLSNRQSRDEIVVRPFEGLNRIQADAAGMDIGAHEIMVCVPGPGDTQVVRAFGTYTVDLYAIADWLRQNGVQTVAMESTGVYWIPVFETLEGCGFKCCLISATAIMRFPGRKTDVLDCQWIQTLHSYGLLADSFRTQADLVALRTLLRHREQLIAHRSPHVLHMQKALLQMNVQLSQVLSDVTGVTGLAIIRAIVGGERDAHKLAALRNYRCKKDEQEIAKALTGTWRAEHLFVLEQALALFDFYTQQIEACDAEIERTYATIRPDWGDPGSQKPLPPAKAKSHSRNAPKGVEVRRHLKRIAGVDIIAVHGISVSLAQTIIAEIGTDMSRFPTEKHICSWLGLAPHNEITGGKVIRSYTLKNHNRAGQAFRQAAASVARSNCAYGAFYRRLKSRIGPAQAIVATAHKIARTVYHMLKFQLEYQSISAGEYEERFREREVRYLQRKAAQFGFSLSPSTVSATAVS
jgi:transposase